MSHIVRESGDAATLITSLVRVRFAARSSAGTSSHLIRGVARRHGLSSPTHISARPGLGVYAPGRGPCLPRVFVTGGAA